MTYPPHTITRGLSAYTYAGWAWHVSDEVDGGALQGHTHTLTDSYSYIHTFPNTISNGVAGRC